MPEGTTATATQNPRTNVHSSSVHSCQEQKATRRLRAADGKHVWRPARLQLQHERAGKSP